MVVVGHDTRRRPTSPAPSPSLLSPFSPQFLLRMPGVLTTPPAASTAPSISATLLAQTGLSWDAGPLLRTHRRAGVFLGRFGML